MPDARDQFFKLYNISDDYHRNAFFEAIVSWVQEMRNLAFPKDGKRHSVKLVSACDSAWCATGIRRQAMQLLAGTDDPESRIQAATLLDIVGSVLSFGPIQISVITKHELMNKALSPEVAGIISFVWLDKPETRDARDTIWWTTYQNKQGYAVGLFSLRFPSVEPGYEVERDLSAALSTSQKRAAEELRVLIGAKRSQMEVCSVRPSFNSIVIGPSGSGKTHSVRAAAQSLRLALLELSLGAWMPCGSRTSFPTQLRLAKFVQANTGGVVFIDEADKLKPKHELASD
jgi:hypothetical protein